MCVEHNFSGHLNIGFISGVTLHSQRDESQQSNRSATVFRKILSIGINNYSGGSTPQNAPSYTSLFVRRGDLSSHTQRPFDTLKQKSLRLGVI
jgi:hypothetical protein